MFSLAPTPGSSLSSNPGQTGPCPVLLPLPSTRLGCLPRRCLRVSHLASQLRSQAPTAISPRSQGNLCRVESSHLWGEDARPVLDSAGAGGVALSPHTGRGSGRDAHVAGSLAGSADGSPSTPSTSSSSSSSPREALASAAPGSNSGPIQLALIVGAMAVVTGVCAGAMGQGPSGLVAAVTKSGFAASFSLIFVSEIGDKTFFIAALLAMKYSKSVVLAGAVTALGLMSAISAVIGRLFREVPAQLKTSIPVGEYLACALLVWFGVSSIRSALALPAHAHSSAAASAGPGGAEEMEEGGELAEAREYVDKSSTGAATPVAAFWETFCLVFLAEWGDRSMLATIALGAAQSPVGVALGATWGHLLATGIAVLGGALLSQHISERTVGLTGGVLFLVFAAATLMGYA